MSKDAVQSFESFRFLKSRTISSLNLEVQEFEHIKTGAQHIHFASDNEENVFLVALRTVPKDSTGVAHILEHTALCGSKKYPVRDPFFMMTRRSLNTFMNAFTSSDWTAYPFASFNKKDYYNLLDVYLDAVFFSRLDPLDFAQEGHRLEFKEANNPESALEYKGVVFNEMKGAMSSMSSQLWHTMGKYLFPTNTYHFNSGGEPADIPDLTYDELLEFYRTHYHPSNATFMTFGDIPAHELQERFEKQALDQFDRSDVLIEVKNEKRYFSPIKVQEGYANNDDELDNKTHVVMGWLLGESTNLVDALRAQLISSVLLDNSACPLMHAIESSDLGQAPSPLCGLEDSQKELSFMCGLADCGNENTQAVEAMLLETLEKIASEGIPKEDLDAALHQLELSQREVGGDSYPYGLQIILKSISSATHRGDPATVLDLDTAIEGLRADIEDPNFVSNYIKDNLLQNPHRVTLTLSPDPKIAEVKLNAELAQLEAIKNALSDDEKQKIIKQSEDLKTRQESDDDVGLLPKVTLSDVPADERSIEPQRMESAGKKIYQYKTGTNGICYRQIIFSTPELNTEQLKLIPLYSSCLTELGAGSATYLDMQKAQTAATGGISSFSSIRSSANKASDLQGFYIYSGKALTRNLNALNDLLYQYIVKPRFDELPRIRELIAQIKIGMEQSVTGSGHSLAMTAAAAGISPTAALSHELSGLEAIRYVKQLEKSLADDSALEQFSNNLSSLHEVLSSGNYQHLYIGDELLNESQLSSLSTIEGLAAQRNNSKLDLKFEAKQVNEAWLTNTQVNFCAKAYPTVLMGHADAAPLVVLGNYLRNGFLHKAIREQGGAYGGGAAQDSNNGSFRFFSYRDPRMSETLTDFDASIQWIMDSKVSADKLEEAVLGTASSLDRSESPAGQAKRCFQSELHNRTPEMRKEFRERVLACTFEDLQRVAQSYLTPDKAHTAVVTNKDNEKQTLELGLSSQTL